MIHEGDRHIILKNNGIGYKVFVLNNTLLSKKDSTLSLWTYNAIREDANDLFGFKNREELDFFELLISISGIGPKTALGILNTATLESLIEAASSGEISHLVQVSGIGKKTAQKIVLELRDKFKEKEYKGSNLKDEVETLEALKSLGYSHKDVKEALDAIPKTISGTAEKIKYALKFLGGGK